MGRAGTGASATSRALSPMRSTRSSPTLTRKSYGNKQNSSKYRSMGHLRALHAELVEILDESSDTAATDKSKVSGAGGARAAKRDLRLIEILRAISELVRDWQEYRSIPSQSVLSRKEKTSRSRQVRTIL